MTLVPNTSNTLKTFVTGIVDSVGFQSNRKAAVPGDAAEVRSLTAVSAFPSKRKLSISTRKESTRLTLNRRRVCSPRCASSLDFSLVSSFVRWRGPEQPIHCGSSRHLESSARQCDAPHFRFATAMECLQSGAEHNVSCTPRSSVSKFICTSVRPAPQRKTRFATGCYGKQFHKQQAQTTSNDPRPRQPNQQHTSKQRKRLTPTTKTKTR